MSEALAVGATLKRRRTPLPKAAFALAVLSTPFLVSDANAHGSHARFLQPGADEAVSEHLEVRIARAASPFPYVFLEIKRYLHPWARQKGLGSGQAQLWSGLVPVGETGYVQKIDVSGWPQGQYVIEAKFVGDWVENVQSRRFVVKSGEDK